MRRGHREALLVGAALASLSACGGEPPATISDARVQHRDDAGRPLPPEGDDASLQPSLFDAALASDAAATTTGTDATTATKVPDAGSLA